MSNITPENIDKLNARLGGKVSEYFTAGGDETSVSFVNSKGISTVAIVKKMDLTVQFQLSLPTIKVDKDFTVSQVIAAFSKQFGLGLVEGVDYAASQDKVQLTANMLGSVPLRILDNSFLYKGTVNIRITTETGGKLLDSMATVAKTFQLIFFQGILSISKPFSCASKAFNGNQLSPELVEAVKTRLKTSDYVTQDNLNILRNATVFRFQAYKQKDGTAVIRVYLRDANRNLLAIPVTPQDDKDRPF